MLIDSSILIDHLRGRPQANQFLVQARQDGQLITHAVAVAEVLSGARSLREQQDIETFLAKFRVTHPDSSDSAQSLILLGRHRLAHGIGWLDCIIAASALRLSMPVATLNDRHFAAIPGLQIVRPY